MGKPDTAGRVIAGLLGYNPGPGIYSRLERAIEAMPESVRVQELPGLLKRYKEGVPGWELKATDLDEVIAGRDVVPREELLARVKERSPVYTHTEVVLGGSPQTEQRRAYVPVPGHAGLTQAGMAGVNDYQQSPSSLGRGVSHGEAAFERYGQGGDQYGEIVLLSPEARQAGWGRDVTHHFHKDYPAMKGRAMSPEVRDALTGGGAAHARFDVHDGFLRINELQSDLGIHNRKVREAIASHKGPPPQLPSESDSAYLDRVQEQGYVVQMSDDGEWNWVNDPNKQAVPFPLEDASLELLLKRLNLYAAQNGLRGVEIASPRAIADKVGGNIDNYEHAYGKVAVGQQERLGRKMGGMVDGTDAFAAPESVERVDWPGRQEIRETVKAMPTSQGDQFVGREFWKNYSEMIHANLDSLDSDRVYQEFGGWGNYGRSQEQAAADMYERLSQLGYTPQEAQAITSRALFEAPGAAAQQLHYVNQKAVAKPTPIAPVSRRYIMSDEMRRRLIEGGVGAAVGAGIMSDDDLIERLNQ